jgi:flagellar motility protein MotE (MotC chaperone)
MKNFLKKLPMNIFTLLMIAAGLAFAFRLVNVATYATHDIGSIVMAKAQEQVNEQPPPLMTSQDVTGANQPAPEEKLQQSDINLPSINRDIPPDTSSTAGQRSFNPSEIEVLQSLARRRGELDKREQALSAREALLTAAEQEVDRKITELNKLRSDLEALLGKQEKMEEERIASLVKIYENMKPKEAAEIFNTLDMDILLAVVSRMSERKTSPILASMNTDRARLLTIKLAEMRKLPGDKRQPPGR